MSRILTGLVQGLSLILAVAFVMAVALNQFVFERWGLNFAQVSTPSDVLMSGLDIGFRIFLPVIVYLAALLVAKMVVDAYPRAYVGLLILGVAIFLFCQAMQIVAAARGALWPRWLQYVSLIGWASILSGMLSSKVSLKLKARAALPAILAVIAPATSLAEQYRSPHGPYQQLVKDGYVGRALWVEGGGRVLWVGEKAVVVRCSDSKVAVRIGPENYDATTDKPASSACFPIQADTPKTATPTPTPTPTPKLPPHAG